MFACHHEVWVVWQKANCFHQHGLLSGVRLAVIVVIPPKRALCGSTHHALYPGSVRRRQDCYTLSPTHRLLASIKERLTILIPASRADSCPHSQTSLRALTVDPVRTPVHRHFRQPPPPLPRTCMLSPHRIEAVFAKDYPLSTSILLP